MQALIQGTEDLDRQVRKIITSHGAEGIELFPVPTIILGSAGKLVRRGTSTRRLRFLARQIRPQRV